MVGVRFQLTPSYLLPEVGDVTSGDVGWADDASHPPARLAVAKTGEEFEPARYGTSHFPTQNLPPPFEVREGGKPCLN